MPIYRCNILVQSLVIEGSLRAAGLAVVEVVEAHIGFLDLFGPVIEGVAGVRTGRYSHCHLWSEDGVVHTFDTFRDDFKDS